MIIVVMFAGRIYQKFGQLGIASQSPTALREYEQKMEQSFMILSPTSLFQLLMFCKRKDGTRAIAGDGSGGFCKNASSIVSFKLTANAVRFKRHTKNAEVKSSARTLAYLHLGGKRYYPIVVAYYHLRDIARSLFGIDMTLDWGISDHADAFSKVHLFFHDNPALLDDTGIASAGQIGMVSQLSQDEFNHQVLTEQKTPVLLSGSEAALNCYFHVMQAFKKNSSFVKKVRNRSLLDSKKGDVLYHHVRMIHLTKTPEQRNCVICRSFFATAGAVF